MFVSDFSLYSLKDSACTGKHSPLSPVKVTYHAVDDEWELVQGYQVEARGFHFHIKKGFRFDLASIPRLVWWLIAPFELSLVAPLIHDFIYFYKGELPIGSVKPQHVFVRKETDAILLELMEKECVPMWRRLLAYHVVRALGAGYWED